MTASRPVWTDEAEMAAALRTVSGGDSGALEFYRSGWDSVAIATRERIFKFPRHQRALAALRREAAILAQVARVSPLPVPDMRLHEGERPFSEHRIVPGAHLLAEQFESLSSAQKGVLAEELAGFHLACHGLEIQTMTAAGAGSVEAWWAPDAVEKLALPALPEDFRDRAAAVIAAYADLPPDPYGEVYGHFDAHGWNMAFDHRAGRLNGIYDFADSGIGPLHRDFVYSSFVSWELTRLLVAAYARRAGRTLDIARIHVLVGYHRLWELATAVDAGGPSAGSSQDFRNWTEYRLP